MSKLSSLGLAVVLGTTAIVASAQEVGTIRLAEADSFSGEDLVQLIAYERAGERGVEVDVTSLNSDDVTFQAVLNGQMDMGVGDSYEAIANLGAPVRNIYQIRKLAYVPVVDKTIYPDWASLDGEPFVVHSRGSGTETMAQIMQQRNGIEFSEISFVPGSEVRVVAMQRGNISATYLDLTNSKILFESDPERFGALPAQDQDASDSTLYVNNDFLSENGEAVQILLEELLKSAQSTVEDPSWPARMREELGLLPELSDEEVADITPYFEQAVAAGIFPTDGGGQEAATADLEFIGQAGGIDAELLSDPTDFWAFEPLDAARVAVE